MATTPVVSAMNQAVGSEFWVVKKGIVSSTIVTGGVDLTGACTGDIAITDWIVQTDATGLAAATNFQIQSNNTNGAAVFAATAVSGLGANKTLDAANFSVTKLHNVINNGTKLQLSCTVTACTGSGTIDVYIKCVRLTSGAFVN